LRNLRDLARFREIGRVAPSAEPGRGNIVVRPEFIAAPIDGCLIWRTSAAYSALKSFFGVTAFDREERHGAW